MTRLPPTNIKNWDLPTVTYKGMSIVKYYSYDATTGVINTYSDIGAPQIVDASKAKVLVTITITNTKTSSKLPYIMRSGNFWYFTDFPLSYSGPRDRYFVLCGILHDIVGVTQATEHRENAS